MSELFREIQEEIEREKWLTLWQRFGKMLIGAAIAVVLLAIAYQVYTSMHRAKMTAYTDKLLEAVRRPSPAEFNNVAKDTGGVHQDIARIIDAQLLVTEGKADQALNELQLVAERSDDQYTNQLARALIAGKDATLDPKSAFYMSGLERSGWAALEAGNLDAASKAFTTIEASESAPQSLKERAKSALNYIQSESSKTQGSKQP